MKCNLILLLTFLLCTSYILSKNEEASGNLKRHRRRHFRSFSRDNSTDTNSTGNDTGPVVLNSIGRKVYVNNASDIILTSFPFQLTRCDQVVNFQAEYIPNPNEYRGRANATFVINAHWASMFEGNTPEKLLRSILLQETTIAPRVMEGTGGCVFIFSKLGKDNDISICLKNANDAANILEVLKTFSECRGGAGINAPGSKTIDHLKIADMIKTCGGKGKFINPMELLKKLKKKKENVSIQGNSDWFSPGFNGVPGTKFETVNGEAPDVDKAISLTVPQRR